LATERRLKRQARHLLRQHALTPRQVNHPRILPLRFGAPHRAPTEISTSRAKAISRMGLLLILWGLAVTLRALPGLG